MTVAPLRYLRRACHSQSADLSGREWTVCGRTPRDHPIVPIQNLSRSLADLDEMRIVTFPRIVLHGSGILLVRLWVESRPRCLSKLWRRIPVPASQHTNTPTMIIFGQPTRQPTACQFLSHGWGSVCVVAVRCTILHYAITYKNLAPDNHQHHHHCHLNVPCVHTAKQPRAQGHISGGLSHTQPTRPGRFGHLRPSNHPNTQPANRWPAEPSILCSPRPELHFALQRRVSTRTLHHRPTQLVPARA